MIAHPLSGPSDSRTLQSYRKLLEENATLRNEIRVAREAAEITASLVVKQFEETERVLRRFQDANAQRKAVLDSATQIAIIATDIGGIITVFNTGAENLLQYSADEVIGKATPEIFLSADELQAHKEAFTAQLDRDVRGPEVLLEFARQGRKEQLEWTYIKKDGTLFPVVLSISGLRDADGSLNGALCIAMDVTEKKRSEKALAESEQNYRFLIDNIPNIVFKGYADGTIDFFDDKIEDLTGYGRALFASRELNWFNLIVEEDLPYVREKFVHALKTDKSYIREYRIRKKNGEIVWLEACSHIACDEKGTVEFVTGAFLDISERKRAEQALHESEEKYRSLFNSGPDPIFVLDREDLKILDANPSAEETYGYYKEELIGRGFEDLGTFEYEEESFAQLGSRNWGQDSVFSQRVKHYRQGGESFYAEVKVCPTTYQDRPAYILASSDITEIIEKDAQLFQASKMTTLGEMSAGIAHELNQPLNAIKIGSDFLRKQIEEGKAVSPEEMHQVVTAVTGQVERASEIIQRLRDFGRKPDFKKEMVSISTTVRDVMSIIGQQLTLQNIKVLYELDDTLPPVLINKNRLEQVIFNLVTNARDAIELRNPAEDVLEGGTITLSTRSEGDFVIFAIADTGVGIPEDRQEKIFEPFFTTKEVGKGMGLGLAITYGIVRDFGGEIEVESTLGVGTRFRVSLPGAENTGA